MRTARRIALIAGLVGLLAAVLGPAEEGSFAAFGSGAATGAAAPSPNATPEPRRTPFGQVADAPAARDRVDRAMRLERTGAPEPERVAREDELPAPVAAATDSDADRLGSEDAARRDRSGSPPRRLALDPVRIAGDGLSLRVTGHDRRGPRALVLWRLHEGRAAVVARGRSRRDGAMEFPRLVAPHTGLVLVASPAWETPDGPRASPAVTVAARTPAPRPIAGGGRRGSGKPGPED